MRLLLARHGNTFEAGEIPRIVGRTEDLPLTLEGEAQAARLAAFLREQELVPDALYCGPLQRTARMAAIVGQSLALPPATIDPRLTELDYGAWAGLTSEEVHQRFGAAEVEAWDRNGIMPKGRQWQPAPGQIRQDINSFVEDLLITDKDTVLAITSNGLLRFFARLVDGLFDRLAVEEQLKVGTGNLCCLEHNGEGWELRFWNRKP